MNYKNKMLDNVIHTISQILAHNNPKNMALSLINVSNWDFVSRDVK